jgi:hypothetical protein
MLLPAVALAMAACGPQQRVGTNVLFACAHPRPDTTGWRRIEGPFPGYTVLAPPALRQTGGDRGNALWEDGVRSVRIFRRSWGEAQFEDRNANAADHSSCWTHIAGMRSYLVIRKMDGGYQVTGWYRRKGDLPASAGPLDGVVSGAARSPREQAVFLRMIESLQPSR